MAESLPFMLAWLAELIFASWLLSYGAEHLAERWGARFVGRTLLSIATTLPEIAIVAYAAKDGSYDTAISAALGSNLLMMTLGLAIMLIIATTKLSKAPMKYIDVKQFKLDTVLLIITAIAGAVMFIDGYEIVDGIIFSTMFAVYLYLAFREIKHEKAERLEIEVHEEHKARQSKKHFIRSLLIFAAGTAGIFIGAEPFVHSLEDLAIESGISIVVLAIIIAPIAGEMPEKISMMILARKGATGASIAVANVLGSKILNNTLLLAIAVFGAMSFRGLTERIPNTPLLEYQMILVTVITLVAIIPILKNKLGLKTGVVLLILYIVGIGLQSILPSL
ncbi:MAG TPA: sodium:calcium antiporter [Nitrosopumilaceae archaeon]|nr:sodium:calcium antiporter [Nitrosopumilaceae archaeon]